VRRNCRDSKKIKAGDKKDHKSGKEVKLAHRIKKQMKKSTGKTQNKNGWLKLSIDITRGYMF
jgi:hypothetical protein